uniref:Integral membrane protein n=1 Tax=Parastrongyloides trichosuri TaxID=131310 RepID=A0A0N5A1B7_PARTI
MVSRRCLKVMITLPLFLIGFFIALICFYYGTYRFQYVLERNFNTTNIRQIESKPNLRIIRGQKYEIKEINGILYNFVPDSWMTFDKSFYSIEYISLLIIILIPSSCFFNFLINTTIYIISNLLFLGAFALTIFTANDAKKDNVRFKNFNFSTNYEIFIKGNDAMNIYLKEFIYIIISLYLILTLYYFVVKCFIFKHFNEKPKDIILQREPKTSTTFSSTYITSKRSLIESLPLDSDLKVRTMSV